MKYLPFYYFIPKSYLEGNHISGNESNVAVISKDLAEQNSLKAGDCISLQADEAAEVKIIGIYEILEPDPAFTSIATYGVRRENACPLIRQAARPPLWGNQFVNYGESGQDLMKQTLMPVMLGTTMNETVWVIGC